MVTVGCIASRSSTLGMGSTTIFLPSKVYLTFIPGFKPRARLILFGGLSSSFEPTTLISAVIELSGIKSHAGYLAITGWLRTTLSYAAGEYRGAPQPGKLRLDRVLHARAFTSHGATRRLLRLEARRTAAALSHRHACRMVPEMPPGQEIPCDPMRSAAKVRRPQLHPGTGLRVPRRTALAAPCSRACQSPAPRPNGPCRSRQRMARYL